MIHYHVLNLSFSDQVHTSNISFVSFLTVFNLNGALFTITLPDFVLTKEREKKITQDPYIFQWMFITSICVYITFMYIYKYMYLLTVTLLVFTQKTKNEPYQGSNVYWVSQLNTNKICSLPLIVQIIIPNK